MKGDGIRNMLNFVKVNLVEFKGEIKGGWGRNMRTTAREGAFKTNETDEIDVMLAVESWRSQKTATDWTSDVGRSYSWLWIFSNCW
jgi:hypothetical protein